MPQRNSSGGQTPLIYWKADVLIVEDEPVSRRALASLVSAHGFATRSFSTAEAALQAVATDGVPHVVLVDFNLPGMNGIEFIRRMAQASATILPVLITAAGSDVLDQIHRDHPVLCFRKPLDFPLLLALLNRRVIAN